MLAENVDGYKNIQKHCDIVGKSEFYFERTLRDVILVGKWRLHLSHFKTQHQFILVTTCYPFVALL